MSAFFTPTAILWVSLQLTSQKARVAETCANGFDEVAWGYSLTSRTSNVVLLLTNVSLIRDVTQSIVATTAQIGYLLRAAMNLS
jgi:hypothetical protein